MEDLLAEDLVGWLFRLGVMIGSVVGVHYYLSKRRCYQLANRIPSPPGPSLIVHTSLFLRGFHKVYRKVWNTPGIKDIFKLWMGPRLLIFISNPADIELILSSQTQIEKPPESKLFEPWLGDGIVIAEGIKWKDYRKVLAPMFHLSIIKSFIPLFNSKSRDLVAKLQNISGKQFDCNHYIREATLEILFEAVLGSSRKHEGGQEYAKAVKKLSEIIRYRQAKFWLHPDTVFSFTKYYKLQDKLLRVIQRFTRQATITRKKEYIKNDCRLPKNFYFLEDINGNIPADSANNNEMGCLPNAHGDQRRLALIDLMFHSCENGVTLMDTEIHDQLNTIMLQGHDTTAITISFFLCVLAGRADIQEKCMEELDKIFGDSDRPVTFEDTHEMKYIERCLMETLRMYPPVPIIARELKQEMKLASTNLTIPANCTVIIDVHRLHMREDLYPNPHVFDPDNFLPEKSASRHYYSYIPFSAGPRSCMGQKYSMLKMKVLLATTLRKYYILPLKQHKDWKLEAEYSHETINGSRIRLAPRKKFE